MSDRAEWITYLDHVLGVVHRPRHYLLPRRLAVRSELGAVRHGERRELDGEHVAGVPEILARGRDALANVRPAAVRQVRLRVGKEARVPESEQDTRREVGLPVGLGGDSLVHEREEVRGLVLNLDVYVKLDVTVLGLSPRLDVVTKTHIVSVPSSAG